MMIVILDAGQINTIIAADALDLLVRKNTRLVMIESVLNELISQSPTFKMFSEDNANRIEVVSTSICIDDRAKRARGEAIGNGRIYLAIADFMMNYIDAVVGNAPALVVCDEREVGRLRAIGDFPEHVRFVAVADLYNGFWYA